MKSNRVRKSHMAILAAASGASMGMVGGAYGQALQPGQISISVAGSTALKNWLVANTNTFTEIQPYASNNTSGGTLTVNGVTYPTAAQGGQSYWLADGGSGVSYQLAPKNNTVVDNGSADQATAINFTYHESGSVEGIYELANDQIYTNSNYAPATGIPSTSIAYVTQNVNRNPDSGNAVWLTYNQIGNSGTTAGTTWNATTGAISNGYTLGNFYATGTGQVGTAGQTGTPWTFGSASNPTPTFTQAGLNVNGGQNAVQVAMSDAIPQQVFVNNYANTSNTYTPMGSTGSVTQTGTANTSFNSSPLDLGFGQGNTAIPTVGAPGQAGIRASYQSPNVLNMPATAQNPRAAQGTTFGVGPWNNATNGGLGNLNSQLTAVTATAMVSNPGTGLTEIDRADGDWLEMTGRLANGATFNMTTRDVNSGTRNVFALDTGVDPSYAVGKDDEGNGTLSNSASNLVFDQRSIGPAMRFSNKTAGGAQLRPTVQDNRMALGTLSINDAKGNDTQGIANPVRVLNYSDSVNGTAPYVSPNYATISNGTYVIYQNEQVVTLRAPGANYTGSTVVTNPATGSQDITGQIQGDDATGDVVTMLNNVANSVANASGAPTPANPADGLLQQGYIIPSLMQVSKNFNGEGLNNSAAGSIATGQIVSQSNLQADGGSFNPTLYAAYAAAGSYGPTALPDLTTQEPTTGTGSTYGGKGSTFAIAGSDFVGGAAIAITATNYLFGNFNQDGLNVRDYNAVVVSALSADRALISADMAQGATVPGSEFTATADNNGVAFTGSTNGVSNATVVPYTSATNGTINLKKGDLIVMGDYNGDGHFDGADLVAMAEGASLSDSTSSNSLTSGDYRVGVLNKNRALAYLNSNVGFSGADGYIRKSGAAILTAASVPANGTPILTPAGAQAIDPVTGQDEFTFDPTGVNTFNNTDVNQDGMVDMNDAVDVDKSSGLDYTNIAEQVGSTQQAALTGQVVPLSLTMANLDDSSTTIGTSSVNAINQALTGSANSNWYGFTLQKSGTNQITWGRTGGTNTVYSGAGLQIAGGSMVLAAGADDPFSDNNATGSTVGNHVAVSVTNGSSLIFGNSFGASTVSALSIDLASNSSVDMTNNHMFIDYGTNADPVSSIRAYLSSGYNGGEWNGPGLMSSMAAETTTTASRYALGYADSADGGIHPPGLPANTIEVKYTLVGDLNLDGAVSGADFTELSDDFGHFDAAWDEGDLGYSGVVNGADFTALAFNFGKLDSGASIPLTPADWAAFDSFAAGQSGFQAAVPEPTAASLLLLGGMGILKRRYRRTAR